MWTAVGPGVGGAMTGEEEDHRVLVLHAVAQREYQVSQTPVLEVRGLSGEIVLARRP